VESAAPEKTTTTAKVGQTVTLTNKLLDEKTAIEVTVAKPKQYAKEPGEFGSKPEKGVFLVVDVTVVCKEGTYSANPFNFKFVAKDGTASEGAFTASFKPALNATDLSAGQKVAGKIVFDIPKAALTSGKIQIDGVGLDYDKPAAYWAL
jgi:methionine-rich copper-binding protein CopC